MTPLARKRQWLQTFGCCLSGREDCDLIHLHEGSGTSSNQKVGDHLTLPMSRLLHIEQHRSPAFWARALPGEDPKHWAVRLHDIWEKRNLDEAQALFSDMRYVANRDYLAEVLSR